MIVAQGLRLLTCLHIRLSHYIWSICLLALRPLRLKVNDKVRQCCFFHSFCHTFSHFVNLCPYRPQNLTTKINSTGIDIYTEVANHSYGEGPNAVYLQPHCNGSEQRLDECSYDTYPSDCYHSQDAGVVYWPGLFCNFTWPQRQPKCISLVSIAN